MTKLTVHLIWVWLSWVGLAAPNLMAQQPNNFNAAHFYFGDNSVFIDYSSGNGVPGQVGLLKTFEGSASLADVNGNLLFYTNGGGRHPNSNGPEFTGMIWNANHDTLANGFLGWTRGGRHSAEQPAVAFPAPGSNRFYYIFTMEEAEYNLQLQFLSSTDSQALAATGGAGLGALLIDMAQDNGLGAVVADYPKLLTPSYEHLSVTRHANGVDYWVCAFDADTDELYAFPVTSTGIGTPVVSSGGFVSGNLTFAPNGQRVGIGTSVFNFNNSTGTVGTLVVDIPDATALCFSPNSNLLYACQDISGTDQLTQYNLLAGNILGSQVVLGTGLGTGRMTLTPDYKILVGSGFSFMGCDLTPTIINCPNVLGTGASVGNTPYTYPACYVESFGAQYWPGFDNTIFQNTETCPAPINPAIIPPVADLGPDVVACPGDTVLLYTPSVSSQGSYLWSTGATSQIIEVTQSGTYDVFVTNQYGLTDRDTVTVTFATPPSPNLGNDTVSCVALNLTLNAGIGFDSYLWSTGATTQSLAANAPGLYWVEVTAGNCTLRDSIQITQAPISIELGGDTAICEGTSLTLSPGNNFATYLWQNNSTASSLTVSTQGAYSVTVTDANNCQASDNIFVSVLPPPTANFGSSSNGLVVTFDNTSNGATAYEWDLGDNTFSTLQDPTHTYTAAGTYVVCLRAVVLNNCEDVFCDTITVTTTTGLPNTFTQLGLNLYPNQTTGPLTLTSPTPLGTCHLQVLNATGQLVATYQYASAGNVLQLSVAQLPAGSYILRLNGPHGEAFARFIRQ